VIDGDNGDNFRKALTAFQQQNGFNATGALDPDTFDALAATSEDPVIGHYVDFTRAGIRIVVADVPQKPRHVKVTKIVIDKPARSLSAFDADGNLVGFTRLQSAARKSRTE